ncbi:MAG TPA: polysaccharide deacetylase family protein [Mycobacteriales bacterium]|nr:polysaccharide deacetylase family protein [Mycobacteriales bacterium]
MRRRDLLRGAAVAAAGVAVGRFSVDEPPVVLHPGARERGFAGRRSVFLDSLPKRTNVVWRVQTERPLIALTFDDGPVPAYTQDYLDMLREQDVRATFNLVGRSAVRHPDLVRRELADRHQVENHSWSHRDLSTASPTEAIAEVQRGTDALESLTGRVPRYFRPPLGNVSGATLAAVASAQQDVLLWSVQLREAALDVDANVAHVLARVEPGSILLAHDASHHTIDRRVGLRALPIIIQRLRDRGFEFVTVDELVGAGTPIGPPDDVATKSD